MKRWDGGGGLKTLHYGINLEGEAKDHDNRRKRYATPREDVVTVSVFEWEIFCSIALTVQPGKLLIKKYLIGFHIDKLIHGKERK